MVGATEARPLINLAILEDSTESVDRYVVSLLGFISCITVLDSVMQIRVLIPRASHSQKKWSPIDINSQATEANRHFKTCLITAGYRIEVS